MATLIAVIDDDESVRDSLRTLLRSAGYRVMTFESAGGFLESGARDGAECLILDVRMPGMEGPELQARLKQSNSRVPIVFITAHEDSLVRERVLRAGAVDVLSKPFAPQALLSTVQAALRKEEEDATNCATG
ncbi:MAG TPA: response regulator [Bryobacteraceae bacterium]|nr:response regulator [Bryobacteraceae bacterium]